MSLPFEILALLSPEGFEKRFYKNCKETKTNFEAYEVTEREYKSIFNKRKYSSYDSFRVSMTKRIKKRN
tara:strand:- start:356 stop:562 length:207 start_codon:yes stop_codon:yes gene_type:complete